MYLDNASTTPLKEEVKRFIISLLDDYGNPSSQHRLGDNSRKIIENSRANVAKFINANTNNIIFTSSGSASNTLGIKGYYQKNNCYILYSPIAHKSILKCVWGYKHSSPLKVDSNGIINIEYLKKKVDTRGFKSRDIKFFVVIDYANSEIGVIQNVKQIIDIVHLYNGIVMIDCTGSISTTPLDVKYLDVDIATFSAHKLGGLKGCGVLYKKTNIELEPLIYGNQEQGLVGGTENVLGIAALGKAIENYDYSSISSDNRDYVYDYLIKNIEDCYLVGSLESRLPHNLYMCFRGVNGEFLMTLLDINDIQVSIGSACNNRTKEPSTTLTTIGLNESDVYSCIRITFNGKESKEELDYLCNRIKECVNYLREFK